MSFRVASDVAVVSIPNSTPNFKASSLAFKANFPALMLIVFCILCGKSLTDFAPTLLANSFAYLFRIIFAKLISTHISNEPKKSGFSSLGVFSNLDHLFLVQNSHNCSLL